jgi:hypothetical protein
MCVQDGFANQPNMQNSIAVQGETVEMILQCSARRNRGNDNLAPLEDVGRHGEQLIFIVSLSLWYNPYCFG